MTIPKAGMRAVIIKRMGMTKPELFRAELGTLGREASTVTVYESGAEGKRMSVPNDEIFISVESIVGRMVNKLNKKLGLL